MSAEVTPHPSAPELWCEFCPGSPVSAAETNVAFELEGQKKFWKRTANAEMHICTPCLARLFQPFASGLARLDLAKNFEPVRGTFIVLPLRRLQRKRR